MKHNLSDFLLSCSFFLVCCTVGEVRHLSYTLNMVGVYLHSAFMKKVSSSMFCRQAWPLRASATGWLGTPAAPKTHHILYFHLIPLPQWQPVPHQVFYFASNPFFVPPAPSLCLFVPQIFRSLTHQRISDQFHGNWPLTWPQNFLWWTSLLWWINPVGYCEQSHGDLQPASSQLPQGRLGAAHARTHGLWSQTMWVWIIACHHLS